ncbi:DMT family transporter [Rhodovibrionaceae bacterium A322]
MSDFHPKPWLGIIAATMVVAIWSGWIVASRAGAQSPLTVYDITAIRYGISSLIAIPLVLYFKPWRGLTFKRMALLSLAAGWPYALASYGGFNYAPAAHGGVYMNGALPALALLFSWIWLKEKPRKLQIIGAILIIIGAGIFANDFGGLAVEGAWLGDLLFIASALSFTCYMVLTRLWAITLPQVLLCVATLNSLTYVPVWWAFLPSNFADASQDQILLQVIYQGLVPNLVGMMLVAVAARHAGPAITATLMAAVPATGTLLSIIFLGEIPGDIAWLGIAVLTGGILMTTLKFKGKSKTAEAPVKQA